MRPCCAIETTQVERVRFGDVTPAFAAAEGEGDASLADWRAGHQSYYDREAARIGLSFTDDSELDLSHFRVLQVFQRAGQPDAPSRPALGERSEIAAEHR